jgi:predicted secreted protein with PEFG-CTERM motif
MQKSCIINISPIKEVVDKILAISIVVMTLILFSSGSAYATNHTTSIFSDAQRFADSNTYKNMNYGISIQPPLNWIELVHLPPSLSNHTIVTFSNNDKSQLATFGISHRSIEQNVIDVLNRHSDNDILSTIAQEMSIPSTDSKTVVYKGIVDRYTDGIRVAVSSGTQYTVDNSTSLSENIIFFLNSGNQYTLELTTGPNNIDKDSQLFEDSVNTFLVSQTNPVPEFPVTMIILIIAMVSIIFISRIKNQTQNPGFSIIKLLRN